MAYDYGMTHVVGGTGAQPEALPWLIQHPWQPDKQRMCRGSLISTQWVLTAAHRFIKARNIGIWSVVIRVTQLTQLAPGAKVHHTEKLLVHQQYSAVHQRNYITLLEWEQPVKCSLYLELACV
ncbi:ACRO protein, partial [Mohoua ochrocephala]|nr:ACRO protein [Mohoua ochrocephala]